MSNDDSDYDLKNQMEEALDKKLRSRLNGEQRIACNEHFFNTYPIRFGSCCCFHCRKTIQQLRTHWEAKQIIEGLDPKARDRPYLTIQEINGRGVDSIDSTGEIIPFGNVEWACFSCQQKYCRFDDPILPDTKSSYQARKGRVVRRKFPIKLTNVLSKGQICYKAMINKWTGKTVFDCSQDLLEACFDTNVDVIWKLVDVDDVMPDDEECKYSKCNGKHVIFSEQYIKHEKTDFDVFQEEQGNRDI